MPIICIEISEKANSYIRRRIRKRYGMGLFISELLVLEEAREQAQEALARQASASGQGVKAEAQRSGQ